MKSVCVLAIVFAAITSVMITAQVSSTAAKAGMDPERLSRISTRMKQFVETGTIPGAVTLVARHGVVVSLDAVGYQDLDTKTPMRTNTIFQIRSMTKSVTAVAIMILVEEGRLLLSDPVEKHLPEFYGQGMVESRDANTVLSVKGPSRPPTVRDLLTSTSGLAQPAVPRMAMSSLDELVGLLAKQPLEFEPGTKWVYSEAAFLTLGRIVEVVSGQAYERFVEDRVFKPLGMVDSFFRPPVDKHSRIVSFYVSEDGKLRKVDADLYPTGARLSNPAFGAHSTAADMAAFYQMMLNGGTYRGRRLLSPAAVRAMTMVHTGNLAAGFSPGKGWGLGWEIAHEPSGTLSLTSIGTFGHGAASSSYGWVDPTKDLVGVILIMRPGAGEVRDAFMAMAAAAIID